MRLTIALFLCAAAGPAIAQPVGTYGACMLETAKGEGINIGSCERRAANCNPTSCTQVYHWPRDAFDTILTTGSADSVRDAFEMNGQDAYAPAALVQGDPRDCVYNSVTDGVFCFVEGAEAHAFAVDGLGARAALVDIARAQGDGPLSAGHDHPEVSAPAGSGKKGSGNAGTDLLAAFQGKYRPVPSWDCGEIGAPGGATAIRGDVLYGLETECRLSDGNPVGSNGAVIFNASCTGEGETWADEYILQRDRYGNLAVLGSDAVSQWESCD